MTDFFAIPKTAPPCPHCGQECLGLWAKTSLGPALRKRCMNCQKYVSVAPVSSVVLCVVGLAFCWLGGLAAAFALGLSSNPGRFMQCSCAVAIVLCPILFFLSYRMVPLVSREA